MTNIKANEKDFPRITLKCKCGNEFNLNVLRLRDKETVNCMVCGEHFSEELGEKFAKALEDLYLVKYTLEKNSYPFHFSFKYKSSYSQPPAPYPFHHEDKH
ncbi:MAG: hypothetical protein WCK67_05040 [bacterium]